MDCVCPQVALCMLLRVMSLPNNHGCLCLPCGSCVVAMCLCRQGVADGQADFDFARRSDGTMKEMQGALGGLCVVSGKQHEKALKQLIEQVCAQ